MDFRSSSDSHSPTAIMSHSLAFWSQLRSSFTVSLTSILEFSRKASSFGKPLRAWGGCFTISFTSSGGFQVDVVASALSSCVGSASSSGCPSGVLPVRMGMGNVGDMPSLLTFSSFSSSCCSAFSCTVAGSCCSPSCCCCSPSCCCCCCPPSKTEAAGGCSGIICSKEAVWQAPSCSCGLSNSGLPGTREPELGPAGRDCKLANRSDEFTADNDPPSLLSTSKEGLDQDFPITLDTRVSSTTFSPSVHSSYSRNISSNSLLTRL
mmetsp:Transcript_74724/g.155781  ORF Transcript_74724/g.155781 Transcript_74724/m.155781 type:complete len:264 (-) Transcript_74724:106-897(-)